MTPVTTAWHCCLEFYSLATRLPPEYRRSPADAVQLVEEEIIARTIIHDLPAVSRPSFLHAAVQDSIAGAFTTPTSPKWRVPPGRA